MKTIIIELAGRIAAGKSTLASQLMETVGDKYRIIDLKEIKIGKLKLYMILTRFICRHPVFTLGAVKFIIKKGAGFHNTVWVKLQKLKNVFKKWAYADYMGGVYLIDEGITKKLRAEKAIKLYPENIKLIIIYVTADVHTRKERIIKRLEDNPNIKESHRKLAQQPDLLNKLRDNKLHFWKKKSSEMPCFIIDSSPSQNWDKQFDDLLQFLDKNITDSLII